MNDDEIKQFDRMCWVVAGRPLFINVSATKIQHFIEELLVKRQKKIDALREMVASMIKTDKA